MQFIRQLSYPRRQQLRRLKRAAAAAAVAVVAVGLALRVASAGSVPLTLPLVIPGAGLGAYTRHSTRLAGRSAVGARSEADVQRALGVLEWEGWKLRHSLPWHGRGDIDHLAIAPTGVAFAIETKTRTYEPGHVALVRNQAAWLGRHRRRWCPGGAVPTLCIARALGVEQMRDEVLVVSADRLVATLRTRAGTAAPPAFLAPGRPGPTPTRSRH